jgi:Flp pilus assembly protein TadG
MMQAPNLNYRKFNTMRGLATLEFVLLMSFAYAPMLLGTVEIGRILYQYNSIVKSVRDSARYISLYSATDPSYATQVTNAKCLAAFGNTACTGSPIAPGLTAGQVTIATSNAGGAGSAVIKLVTVQVSGYQLGYVTTVFVNGGFKAFNNISVAMRQATT